MLTNPFSPLFGGKPQVFFGREDILDRFDLAMIDAGSDDRALFITGARGDGKTALVEKLSQNARDAGRRVIDLGPENTVGLLLRSLVGHTESTRTISPQASISVLGSGAGISAGSFSTTTRIDRADAQQVFLEVSAKEARGLLITIDEVQKVSEGDMSAICNAFQMASRKGHDVMLVVAGLPYAHAQVIHYQGCTFMRRAAHEELGLFTHEETAESFRQAFATVQGFTLADSVLDAMIAASMGHPYLMQLLGYYLISRTNQKGEGQSCQIDENDVQVVVSRARLAFERRALRPMVGELTDAQREYLRATAQIICATNGESNAVRSGEVAQFLGKETKSLSSTRESLVRLGILLVPAHGQIMFGIPYLRSYLLKAPETGDVLRRAQEWNV